MEIIAVVGEQRGDEGKGRLVDELAAEADIVARGNGGPNAGHTVCSPDGEVYKLHLVPSGIIHPHTLNIIGPGALVDPEKLVNEIGTLQQQGVIINEDNFNISGASHLIIPSHIILDANRESGPNRQGSTKSGIAPGAASKYMRSNGRMEMINNPDDMLQFVYESIREIRSIFGQLFRYKEKQDRQRAEDFVKTSLELGKFITDTTFKIHQMAMSKPDLKILAEGAQAFQLDIDHGMYPMVTSSSTTAAGLLNGIGLPPKNVKEIIGVSKMIQSHVGDGSFVTEIHDEKLLDALHGDKSKIDAETGTTTGRVRRLGHYSLPDILRSQMVNGTTSRAVTKFDWLPRYGDQISICDGYYRKGKLYKVAPDADYKRRQCVPHLRYFPTWKEDISKIRVYEDLPQQAKDIVEFIEESTQVNINFIGVGPGRDEAIVK